jgi:putative oxidoreductase
LEIVGSVEGWGLAVQRLYSTFPSGRPGIGLLLLRVAAGGSLIVERISMMTPLPPSPLWEAQTTLIVVGVCVCLGFWTPVMGVLEGTAEVLMAVSRPVASEVHLLLAVLAFSLAMLGPGAWSIDAALFGRKRIAI